LLWEGGEDEGGGAEEDGYFYRRGCKFGEGSEDCGSESADAEDEEVGWHFWKGIEMMKEKRRAV
jgi:hypothetical protein